MKRRDVLALGLAACSAPLLGRVPAFAQNKYPDRPIRLVVPWPPGGVNDAVGRPWADRMKSVLGTVIVENQGGAGGSLGAAAVARAQPDGYTLLLGGAGTHVFSPMTAKRALYNPLKDFEAICILAITGPGIAVSPSAPFKTLRELIDYAKVNPGKLSYGSPGVGSPGHLAGELFKTLIGAPDIVHVPYKGAGPALTDLMSGQILLATPTMTGNVLELHQSGKIRVLAVAMSGRLSAAPDLPTAIEAGLPGMLVQSFAGIFAPAGTPNAIVDQIAKATRTVMAEPDYQRMLIASGFEPYRDSTPEKTRQFVEQEITRWRPVIEASGMKLE
jgi:tripartite-type tricarboxylate transporter receptor subunit TctC